MVKERKDKQLVLRVTADEHAAIEAAAAEERRSVSDLARLILKDTLDARQAAAESARAA